MNIKEKIQELCKRKNISANKLEKDLGLGSGYISKLGKSRPNTKYLQMIADYLDTTTSYLLDEKYEMDYKLSAVDKKIIEEMDSEFKLKLLLYATLLSDVQKKSIEEMIDNYLNGTNNIHYEEHKKLKEE